MKTLTMTLPRRRVVLGLSLAALGGCATPAIDSYRLGQPALDLRRYLNGPIRAHGMVSDRQGRVERRFVAHIIATWRGDEGTLDEDFIYDDGEKQKRIWRLRHLGDGRYTGRADDVVGEAVGAAAGHAFHWRYTMRVPWRGSTIDVDFDDWSFLVDDRVMLNRATITKFGIRLGQVQIAFEKLP